MSAERGVWSAESGRTLVCFALEDEARAFRKLIAGRENVSILITGIGRQNARKSVGDFLQKNSIEQAFTCGFAGALDPVLQIGDVVFLAADWLLDKALVEAGAKPASFYCASHVVTTVAGKSELRKTTKAGVVEMESGIISEICAERGIPCATVRVISDSAQEDLPLDFNKLSNPDQSLNFGKLALAIAKSPGKIPALMRLRKNTELAAKNLAGVLGRVIKQRLDSPAPD